MILTEFDQQSYEEFLKKENFREGKEEGIKEGALQKAKGNILLLLSKFGNNTAPIEEMLNRITDEKLVDNLFLKALEIKSIEQFESELQKYL